jgi:hypothetical protein
MSVARAGERRHTGNRSERVFTSNGQWYFRTREGVDVGPYESQFEAEIEAAILKELPLARAIFDPNTVSVDC